MSLLTTGGPAAASAAGAGTSMWRSSVLPTLRYLLTTEVHTYSFSVAANAILSFVPFIVLLLSLVRNVFHSQAMYDVVISLLRDYLPVGQDFVIRNLRVLALHQRKVEIVSLG